MSVRSKINKKLIVLAVSLAAAFVTTATADILHVPGDFPTIQEAIDVAVNGDEVVVADVAVAMRLRRNPYKSDRIEFRNRHDDCIDRAFVGDHE